MTTYTVEKTVKSVGNAIAHPINTFEGIANLNTPLGIANMAVSVNSKIDAYKKGTGFEKWAIISETVTDVVTAVVGTKGIGAGVKGAGTSTTLFRAGSEVEAIGATKNGFSMLPSVVGKGSYETGKLFATSATDAAEFGRSNFLLDGVPNVIMKAKVPSSIMKTATTLEADGMKAVSIASQQLHNIQFKGVLNSTPKPTNPFQWTGRW